MPITMSAEREAEIRKGSFYPALQHPQFYVDAKKDLEKELAAERAAHDSSEQTIRERCAKEADKIAQYYLDLNLGYSCTGAMVAKEIAAAIRNAQAPAGQPTQLERERELSDQLAAALKEKRCTCNSTGLQHKPGYTHYETDAGEECPAYHYGPCPRCESARAALAQHALLRATPAHNSGTDPA